MLYMFSREKSNANSSRNYRTAAELPRVLLSVQQFLEYIVPNLCMLQCDY